MSTQGIRLPLYRLRCLVARLVPSRRRPATVTAENPQIEPARGSSLTTSTTLVTQPTIRPKRVLLALDEANVRLAYSHPFPYPVLVDYAKALGELTAATAYVPCGGRVQRTAARRRFRSAGFAQVICRRGRLRPDGRTKSDLDTIIIMEIWEAALGNQIDRVVLVSGDSDFVPLVQRLRRMGIEVYVIGPDGQTSFDLISAASVFSYTSQLGLQRWQVSISVDNIRVSRH